MIKSEFGVKKRNARNVKNRGPMIATKLNMERMILWIYRIV